MDTVSAEEWTKIHSEEIQTLCESISRIIRAVTNAKDGST